MPWSVTIPVCYGALIFEVHIALVGTDSINLGNIDQTEKNKKCKLIRIIYTILKKKFQLYHGDNPHHKRWRKSEYTCILWSLIIYMETNLNEN